MPGQALRGHRFPVLGVRLHEHRQQPLDPLRQLREIGRRAPVDDISSLCRRGRGWPESEKERYSYRETALNLPIVLR
jgi:hypothetical protein